MSERTRWWRWTDLAGVVGIVLLLSSVGAGALSESEGAGARVMPREAARVGDVLEFEFIFSDPSGRTTAIGPVATFERRAANETEQAHGAAFAEVTEHFGLNVSFGHGYVFSTPHTVVRLVDAEGHRIGTHRVGFVPLDWTGWDRHHPEEALWIDGWAKDLGKRGYEPFYSDTWPLDYTPDLWSVVDRAVATNIARSGYAVAQSVLVKASIGDEDLYAFQHEDSNHQWLDIMETLGGPGPTREACLGGRLNPGLLDLHVFIHFDETSDICTVTGDRWSSPKSDLDVGIHYGAVDDAGNKWTADLVATTITRGTGAFLPQAERPRLDAAGDRPRITLGEIGDDPRPLVRGVTLPTLRELMAEDDPPAEVQRALQEDATIVGFKWDERRATTYASAMPLEGLVPLPADSGHATRYVTEWAVLFASDDGAMTLAKFLMEDVHPAGQRTIVEWFDCVYADSCRETIYLPPDLDRQVVDPWEVLDGLRLGLRESDIETDSPYATVPDTFAVMPRFDVRAGEGDRSRSSTPLGYWWYTNGSHLPLGPSQIDNGWLPQDDGGVIRWNHRDGYPDALPNMHQAAGAYSLGTGTELYQMEWGRDEGVKEAGPDGGARTLAEGITVTPATSTVPATAGLALLVAAVLARLYGAIAAGIHFPVVATLYAKVRDADMLLHERRGMIVGLLRAEPGLTASDVARRLGFGWGATVHHLQRLQHAGVLRSVRDGQRRRFVVTEDGVSNAEALARGPERARLIAIVEKEPGLTAAELAKRLSRDRTSVARMAARLVDAEALERRRDRRKVRFYPRASE